MSRSKEHIGDNQELTPKTVIRTDYKTFWLVIVSTFLASGAYWDMKREMKGVVHADDLERFGTQLELLNYPLKLQVPKAKDIMRGAGESGSITLPQLGQSIALTQKHSPQSITRQ